MFFRFCVSVTLGVDRYVKDFGYAGMQSHSQQICINMIVMECG
jgi:hypothetical protein